MKISVFNLGCKVNQYEGGGLLTALTEAGHEAAEGLEPADIFILNTCAVTNEAEKKSRQAVARIKKLNNAAKIIVCGCASQNNYKQFEMPDVIYVKGTAGKDAIIEEIERIYAESRCKPVIAIDDLPRVYQGETRGTLNKTRAFVKISDGCDNFCSYCIVPHLRGRLRSKSVTDILKEIDALRDFNEIVLIGIDISSYGKDINSSLAELISLIGTRRLRLGSLEVNVINDLLINSLKKNPEFCPHFHLSLQSGSNEVLKKMNRKYFTCDYEKAIKSIRNSFPQASIMTDIISGFPGETTANHVETLNFARKIGFNDIHVFKYSQRKGTPAAEMPQVDNKVKNERTEELLKLKEELRASWISSSAGNCERVLIEGKSGNHLFGHTQNFLKTYLKKPDVYLNTIVDTVITGPYRDGVLGECPH